MYCPHHKIEMKKLGISWVCPRCEKKIIQPSKFWVPELTRFVDFPTNYDWANFTGTNVSISGGTVSIDAAETEGTLISPKFTNLTRSSTQLREYTKIKIDVVTGSLNDGKILFYASNDGGTTWTALKDDGHTHELNYGNEGIYGTTQSKYSDLRVKVVLKRTVLADESPTISRLKILYNQIPELRSTF